MAKNIKDTSLRDRFDKKGFSPTAYARAHGVSRDTLYAIFSGALTGTKKSTRGESTKRVIAQLKKDGIWIGKLPWEV